MKILTEFWDFNSKTQMCLVEIQNEKWICFQHPDGQHVTQRKATGDDLQKLSDIQEWIDIVKEGEEDGDGAGVWSDAEEKVNKAAIENARIHGYDLNVQDARRGEKGSE